MTPLPKRKHSTARKGTRRNAIKTSVPSLTSCPKCGKNRRPHRACPSCGYYGV